MIQQKKMPIGQFFKATTSTLKVNLKEIMIISLIFSLPGMLLGSSNVITSFITLLSSIVGVLSIIVLIDKKRKGIDTTWKDAIKKVIKNPFVPIMVFILRNIIVNLGVVITPILSQIFLVFLFAALPYAVLEDGRVIESFKYSLRLIKGNFLDVLLKKLLIMLIVNLVVILVGGIFMSNFLATTFMLLLNIVLIIPDLIIYYDIKA